MSFGVRTFLSTNPIPFALLRYRAKDEAIIRSTSCLRKNLDYRLTSIVQSAKRKEINFKCHIIYTISTHHALYRPPYAVPYALSPMPFTLCTMLHALCQLVWCLLSGVCCLFHVQRFSSRGTQDASQLLNLDNISRTLSL